MANPEHLAILKQGVEAWNAWRGQSRELPDLAGADLRGAELQGAQLQHADLERTQLDEAMLRKAELEGARLRRAVLEGANLQDASLYRAFGRWADFSKANLRDAYLVFADLGHATLRRANCTGADFTAAVLREADLSGTNLSRANLTETNLRLAILRATVVEGANFTRSRLGRTTLATVNLANAKDLETALHEGPSSIGLDTLSLSGAALPRGFLQGVGVEERVLNYVSSKTRPKAISFYSCFISYSHADREFARRLHHELQAHGIRCWLDEAQLKVGEEIQPGVLDAIRQHDRVLLCCSEASLGSDWIKVELRETLEKEEEEGRLILLPLDLDGYILTGWKGPTAENIRGRLAADFTGWEQDNAKFEEQFERVVVALRTDDAARERAPQSEL